MMKYFSYPSQQAPLQEAKGAGGSALAQESGKRFGFKKKRGFQKK
jgi:hypothetical protein